MVYSGADVTIPGLGTFYKKRLKDHAGNIIKHRSIGFKQNEIDGFGSVAQHLIVHKGMQMPKAKQAVKEYVDALIQILEEKGSYHMESVGVLKLENDGISISLIADDLITHQNANKKDLKKPWLAMAIFTFLFLVLAWYVGTRVLQEDVWVENNTSQEIGQGKEGSSELTSEVHEGEDEVLVSEEERDTTEKTTELTLSTKSDSLSESVEHILQAQVSYHIIVGSFGECANADKMVRRLIKKRIPGAVAIANGKNGCRVSVGNFPSEVEAKKALSTYLHLNKDAWVFEELIQ